MDDYIREKEGLDELEEIPLFIRSKYQMSDYTKKIKNILEKLSQNMNTNNKSEEDEENDLLINEKKMVKKKNVLCKKFIKLKICDYEKKFNKPCPFAHNINELNVTYYPNYWKELFAENRNKIDKIINKKGYSYLIKCVIDNNIFEVKNLIENGANPTIQDWVGMDSICYAIKNSSVDILYYLIKIKNIDYEKYIEKLKSNYLIYSIKNSNFQIIKLLLKRGSNPNYERNNLKPPIFHAIKRGEKNIIRLLIDYNCNLNKRDENNKNIIDYSISINSLECLSILFKNGAKLNHNSKKVIELLFMSVRNFDNELFNSLLQKGVSLFNKDEKNNNILFEAYFYKNYDLFLKLLKDYGFSDLVNKRNDNEDTILLNIIENNDMKRLLQINKYCKEVDFNIKSKQGYTPLIIASKNGYIDIIEFWIKKNINSNLYDNNSDTALIHACRINNYLVVELLLTIKNIDLNWKNKMNKNCYDYSNKIIGKNLLDNYIKN